jgi:hypothetical protein
MARRTTGAVNYCAFPLFYRKLFLLSLKYALGAELEGETDITVHLHSVPFMLIYYK